MLVGHLADTHVGANHFGVPDYPEDTLEAFKEALELLARERPDVIVIAGDLFDKPRPENRLVIEVARTLRGVTSRGIPVVLGVGEHDQPARRDVPSVRLIAEAVGDKAFAPTSPAGAGDYLEIIKGMTVSVGGGHVIVLPFVRGSPERRARAVKDMLSAVRDLAKSLGGRKVLVAHMGLTTATHPSDAIVSPSMLPPVDYVALGHVHRRLIERGGGGVPPHAYPGTLVPIKADEVGPEDRGPLLVDLSGGEAVIHELRIEQPRSHVVASLRVKSVKSAVQELAEKIRGVPRRRKPTIVHLYLTIPADPSLSRIPAAREVALRASESLNVIVRVAGIYREHARPAKPMVSAREEDIVYEVVGDRDLARLIVELKDALASGDEEVARQLIDDILSPRFDGVWARLMGTPSPGGRGLERWVR